MWNLRLKVKSLVPDHTARRGRARGLDPGELHPTASILNRSGHGSWPQSPSGPSEASFHPRGVGSESPGKRSRNPAFKNASWAFCRAAGTEGHCAVLEGLLHTFVIPPKCSTPPSNSLLTPPSSQMPTDRHIRSRGPHLPLKTRTPRQSHTLLAPYLL